jgi:two-component system response regulator WspF
VRIALVNDLPIAIEALRRALAEAPRHSIAWVARNGAEAVEKCRQDTPDLILMDLIMPVMDGVEATRQIMQHTPCAILVVTVTVQGNASRVFDAMGYGALDAVDTPVLGVDGRIEDSRKFLDKIAVIERLLGVGRRAAAHWEQPPGGPFPALIAVGASTGGPRAVASMLARVPRPCAAAMVIIQHVGAQFSAGLAEWLGSQAGIEVRVARSGEIPAPGVVLVAGTDDHLVMESGGRLVYSPEPRACPYRPSVDAFFKSAAVHWPVKSLGVLLTGMGADGALGLLALRQAGWRTIAQDEATSVVYGMPRAAAEHGAAAEILPIEQIATAVAEFAGVSSRPGRSET